MAIRLDLQPEAIAELVALSRHREQIAAALAAVSVMPPQVGVTGLARKVARKLNIDDHRELVSMFVTLMNYYQTKTRLKITTEAMSEAVTETLKESQTVTDGKLVAWESVKDAVVSAVGLLDHNHSLVQSYKAYRVATSRQYELVDMRVFADMRPVFNDDGDSITQSVITYVLSLDYHDTHDHKVIQFSLDAVDIEELKKLCDRAEKKSLTIKREFASMKWPVSVLGEIAKATDDGNS